MNYGASFALIAGGASFASFGIAWLFGYHRDAAMIISLLFFFGSLTVLELEAIREKVGK